MILPEQFEVLMELEGDQDVPEDTSRRPQRLHQAKALYDWKAERKDDLNFNEGDVLAIVRKSNNGWWLAERDGKIGKVPSNFLEEFDIVTQTRKRLSQVNLLFEQELKEVQGDSGSNPLTPERKLKALAISDFRSEKEQDLNFHEGDIITIIRREGNWWYGVKEDSRKGWLPSNYVQELKVKFAAASTTSGKKMHHSNEACLWSSSSSNGSSSDSDDDSKTDDNEDEGAAV